MSREERIGPALMVGGTASDAGALFLLAQDGAQPSADEAVEGSEQGGRDVLEIAKPAPKHRVEVVDDPREAVAPAAGGLRPHHRCGARRPARAKWRAIRGAASFGEAQHNKVIALSQGEVE